MLMVQFRINGDWHHRAYWGENLCTWGQNFSPSRLPMGPLPKTGEWVRLEIPAGQIGVEVNTTIDSCSLDTLGGVIYWDKVGLKTAPKNVATAEPAKKKEPTNVPPSRPTPDAKKLQPIDAPAIASSTPAGTVKIPYKDFKGGGDFNQFAGNDIRPSKAIWGKRSSRSTLTATFTLAPGEYASGMLKLTTCRHNAKPCAIAFKINGQEIFNGKDRSRSAGMTWGEEEYDIPVGALKAGTNEIVILNMEDT
jgi:hypothetical protein